MKSYKMLPLAFAAVLALAACHGVTTHEVKALGATAAVGSPFTQHLNSEYKAYTGSLQNERDDKVDAMHFARKGLASAAGDMVMPEPLDDWNLSNDNIVEMTGGRVKLVDALENGGREQAPDKAAVAQARFDCWVEQQEENWTADVPCKNQFHSALNDLLASIRPVEPPAPAPAPEPMPAPVTEAAPPAAPVPLEQAMFIVFFDWDKHSLTSGANDVLDAVAAEVGKRKDVTNIVITGHTDSSGSEKYNMNLSKKRSNAVRDALVARGLDGSMFRVDFKGESELLVKTPDNVREPANRRAQISLE